MLSIALLFVSCGKKTIVSSNHYMNQQLSENLPPFSNITTYDVDVVFTTGDQSLSLYGADNVLEHVTLAVENETLVVKYADGVVVVGDDDTTVYIAAPQLATATTNGKGDISLKGSTPQATYIVNSSGDIDAEYMRVDSLTVKINGSGDVDCYANKSLIIERNGRGEVNYQGPPSLVVQGNLSGVERED